MTHCYGKLLFFLSLGLIISMGNVAAAPSPTMPSLAAPIEDPLLPQTKVDRPLSPLEIGRIEREILILEQQGQTLWDQGEPDLAFEQWLRQLRLHQVIPDRRAEVLSLGRIGAIAWENNRVEEAREITARLEKIQQTDFAQDYTLLLPLAEAYQQVRYGQGAIALYQQHLVSLEDPYKPEILRVIAQLAIDWFDQKQAIAAYDQIQQLGALNIGDRAQFALLYEQIGEPAKAIALQQPLTALYLENKDFINLIEVCQKLAENYHQLQDYKNAVYFRKNAFRIAWEVNYYDAAETALQKLAELYLEQAKDDFAIQVYEELLTVQNASYNRYGMMATYGTLGTLYQQTNQYSKALIAWQQGLAIAKKLNHDINYFTQAIEKLPVNEVPTE